jgi:predicted small metal-binding protein
VSVRVIECNFCGETLSAANDAELRACVARHMEADHPDEERDDERVAELVEEQAYSASDS